MAYVNNLYFFSLFSGTTNTYKTRCLLSINKPTNWKLSNGPSYRLKDQLQLMTDDD